MPKMRMFAAVAAVALVLSACATQPAYSPPKPPVPADWENSPHPGKASAVAASGQWWTQLGDQAIDSLIASAFADNPTLAQAVARVDQAKAAAGVANAQRLPAVNGNANATRAQTQNTLGGGSATMLESSSSIGADFSWEIDLWGRIRESVTAAQRRLDARTADAQGARLSLAAQVANNSLSLRACAYSLQVRDADIASRETELLLTRKRRAVGYIAPSAEFSALTNLANARTARISQQEQCTRSVDALVALTGQPAAAVRRLLLPVSPAAASADPRESSAILDDVAHVMPTPPAMQPALPATVLRDHPSLVSAERSLAAAWSDIGVARAQRLPTISLSAMLSGNWLRAAGNSVNFTSWSAGPGLTVPLFDGGAGAANVDAATGRYREAAATLQATLRTVVQNVEDALAFQTSAEDRVKSSQDAVDAAQLSFRASQAQWRAGAISMFELEDIRRQRQTAEENFIAAKRDQGQAWISLMQATGQIDSPG
ncbi:efflux transporter outer membrane subunit [Collimonas fungivorans]|uniref:OprM n=1 Tax=Collimonas fungivorans (strain Ter331) TaxID=1005048 RepID=G0AGY9_COLFT|nr:efflux transporter outer membrane subunit [Collimonas fungivorans]AEK61994.1 OprM [Collimonas fungivorans Ter331]